MSVTKHLGIASQVIRSLAVLLLACFAVSPVFAALTGDLEGTVMDPSGAVVPDATITIRSLSTGATRTVTTNSLGQFAALQLDLGTYEVKVEKGGFAVYKVNAEVRSAEKTRLSVSLSVTPKTEAVTVEGGVAPLLDVATSQVSSSIGYTGVVSLPIQNRDPVQFATLSPGVVPVTKDNPFLGSGSFNSNGSRGRGNNITVDGVTATDIATTGSSGTGTFSLDAVQEVKLISNNFSAELGRNSGSQVQIVTKGGSNEFHGTAYWFHQNAALNARDYFDDTGNATPLIRNLWGFTFGGPVLKNKTFFFGHYEGLKIRGAGSTAIATVLTPADAAAITDPTSRALFTAVGAPTSATGQLSSSAPNKTDQYSWSLRMDQVWRDGSDTLTAKYGENPATTVSPGLTFIGTNLPNFGANVTATDRAFSMGETHTFSPSVVNQFRFAYGRSNPNFPPFTTLQSPLPPLIQITGLDPMGVSNIIPQGRTQNTFQWSDSVSFATGRHSLKTGGDVFYYQAFDFFDSNLRGTVAFASLADFQQGRPLSWAQNFGNSHRHNVSKDFFWFGQDDIRVRPSFTLNLGLRVERSGGVKEKDNILSNLDRGNVSPIGGAGVGPLGAFDLGGYAFRSNLNWAPRLGFSWNPGGKAVVRAGYGWAYDYIFLNPITNLRFTAPFFPSIGLSSGTISGADAYANLVAGTAQSQNNARSSIGVFSPAQVNFGGVTAVQQTLKNPRNQQWNAGLEYEVLRDTVFKVSYVGSRSQNLQASVPLNLINPAARPAPATSEADEIARLSNFRTAFSGLSGRPTSPAPSRFDPRFNGVTQIQSVGSSVFHSLQVDLSRRLSHGISVNGNYTWGHSIDDVSDVLGVLVNDTAGFQDPRNIHLNRGSSQFDVRHRFVGNFLWQVPWARNLSGATGKVFGGWGLSGIVDAQSGFPVTVRAGTRRGINDNVLLGGAVNVTRADGDVTQFHPVPANHPGAASIPSPCSRGVVSASGSTASCPDSSGFPLTQPLLGNLGNSGRNVLRLDKLFNADFALLKDTRITERVTTQFRWEVYNVFNTPNFSGLVNVLSSPAFGQYQSTATDMRQMQGSLKVIF